MDTICQLSPALRCLLGGGGEALSVNLVFSRNNIHMDWETTGLEHTSLCLRYLIFFCRNNISIDLEGSTICHFLFSDMILDYSYLYKSERR